jgi:GTP pyrophosphokinase
MLERTFRDAGYQLTDKGLDGVLKKFRMNSVDDLIVEVGATHISARDVVQAVYPGIKMLPKIAHALTFGRNRRKAKPDGDQRIRIRGMVSGMAYQFAKCCHPLPGDRIVGIVTTGKGITIHTIDCDQLETFSNEPERWLDLGWDTDSVGGAHVGRLSVVVANEPGGLGALTTVIAQNLGNITNLKITNRQQDFFDLLVDVEVTDVRHLTNIIAALRATPAINYVERSRH